RATVTVDGETSKYENVWLASTMKGRFYGGGLMVAPDQDRFDPEGLVSVVTLYKKSRIGTLLRFPSLNKGEHVLKKDWVTVKRGRKVTVSFEEPCALQIDGDVVEAVTTYTVEIGV
ncbi:MAG: diacylglycerol kinase family protein, partial [Firmicutes bacterium]|nr:diacylglycerol kinase family protein [Bacillota bacterium]